MTPCISLAETLIVLWKSPQHRILDEGKDRTETSTAFLRGERGLSVGWGGVVGEGQE